MQIHTKSRQTAHAAGRKAPKPGARFARSILFLALLGTLPAAAGAAPTVWDRPGEDVTLSNLLHLPESTMPDGLTVRANSFRMPGLWVDQVPLTVELEQGDFNVTGTANPNTFLRYGGKLTISGTGDNQVLFDPQPQGVLVLQGAGLDVSGAGSL